MAATKAARALARRMILTVGGGPILTDAWKRGPEWDTPGPVVIAVSVFHYDRYRDLPAIAKRGAELRATWPTRQGAVGLRQWTEPLTRRTGALSVWKTSVDLDEFLRSPEHVATVREFGTPIRGTSLQWEVDRLSIDDLWPDVRRRLKQVLAEHGPRVTRKLTPIREMNTESGTRL